MRDCDFEIISNKNIKLESYNQFYVFDSDRNVHNIIVVKSYETAQVNRTRLMLFYYYLC